MHGRYTPYYFIGPGLLILGTFFAYPLLDTLVPGANAARLLHLAEIDVACKLLLLAVGQEIPWIDVAVWATGPSVSFPAWHITKRQGVSRAPRDTAGWLFQGASATMRVLKAHDPDRKSQQLPGLLAQSLPLVWPSLRGPP